MSEVKDVPYDQYRIPRNVAGSTSLLGFSFQTRKLFEGVVFGGLSGFLVWYIIWYFEFDISIQLWLFLILIVSVPIFVLGMVGVDGYPLSRWLMNYALFRKNRGVSRYSPHPHLNDAHIDIAGSESGHNISGNAFSKMINEFQKKTSEKSKAEFAELNNMFSEEEIDELKFLDDELPEEETAKQKKSLKERLEERKRNKLKEKIKKKERKKLHKELRKQYKKIERSNRERRK